MKCRKWCCSHPSLPREDAKTNCKIFSLVDIGVLQLVGGEGSCDNIAL